jgi:NADH-quinone oxidoreductase subunit L
MGKSAQLPLFTWLPDAMAGPTPVSALIHAATMVTAGIYMISRSHFIYSITHHAQDVILIIGAATAFIAATIATRQNDIKKVLAYSTVSQLGFMFMALGVGAYTAAVFHVITHAFFKALLFLGSGSVIHAVEGEQDIRHMGGLKKYMKTTYMTFLIGCIAIAGIPPLSGFFSKDEIMMHLFASHGLGQIIWAVAVLAAFMTAYYMFRLLFVTFWGEYRGKGHPHESPALMTVPLMVLALFSVIAGFIGIPEVLGGHHWLSSFLGRVITPAGEHAELSHSTEYSLMAFAVVVALSGIGLAYVGFKKYQASAQNTGLASFFENKWYLDELYNTIIVKPIMALSSLLEKFVEKMGIDGLVNGVGKSVQWSSTKVRLMQNGMVGTYLFLLVMGMILLFSLQLIYRLF